MPARIQPNRPYYPRIYPQRQAAAARQPVGRGGRGAITPGTIDTSSTGNVGGDIVKAINNAIQTRLCRPGSIRELVAVEIDFLGMLTCRS
jgi:hypothetical protein